MKPIARRPNEADGAEKPGHAGLAGLRREHLLALSAVMFWGSFHPVAKLALPEISPAWLTFGRMALGLLPLLLLGLATGSLGALRRVSRSDLGHLALVGLCGNVLSTYLVTLSLKYLPAAVGSLLANTSPLVVALVAPLLLGEPLGRRAVVGLVAGLAGLAVLMLPGADPSGAGALSPLGIGLALLGSTAFAFYTVLVRPLLSRYHPIPTSLAVTAFGLPGLLGLALVEGQPWPPAERWPAYLPHLVWAGVVSTGLASAAWMTALRGLRAASVAAFQYFVPAFAMMFAYLLLGERPTPAFLLGAACILLGVAATQARRRGGASRSAKAP